MIRSILIAFAGLIAFSFIHSSVIDNITEITNPQLCFDYDRYSSTLMHYRGRLISANISTIEEHIIQDDGTLQRISRFEKLAYLGRAFIDEGRYYYVETPSPDYFTNIYCFDLTPTPMELITCITVDLGDMYTETLFFNDEYIMIASYSETRTALISKETLQVVGYIDGLYGEHIFMQGNIIVQPYWVQGNTRLVISTIDADHVITMISSVDIIGFGTGIRNIAYKDNKAILSLFTGVVVVDFSDVYQPFIYSAIPQTYGFQSATIAGDILFAGDVFNKLWVYRMLGPEQYTLIYTEESIPSTTGGGHGNICYVEPFLYFNVGFYTIIYNVNNGITFVDTNGNSWTPRAGFSISENDLYFINVNYNDHTQTIYSAFDGSLLCTLYYDTFSPGIHDVFRVKDDRLYVSYLGMGDTRTVDIYQLQNQEAVLISSSPNASTVGGYMNFIGNNLFSQAFDSSSQDPFSVTAYEIDNDTINYIGAFGGKITMTDYCSEPSDYLLNLTNDRIYIRDIPNFEDILFNVALPANAPITPNILHYDNSHFVLRGTTQSQAYYFSIDDQQLTPLTPIFSTDESSYPSIHNEVITINGKYGQPSEYYTIINNRINMVGSQSFNRDISHTFFFPERNKMVQLATSGVWIYDIEYTTVSDSDEVIKPLETYLIGNYPNPFNPETTISYVLAKEGIVSIEVYNIKGQKVKTLVEGLRAAGRHNVVWNGNDVSSGVYFYKMASEGYVGVKKMVLVK